VCRKVTCRRCKKATWKGCGQHIEIVLKNVEKNQQCLCEKPDIGGFFSWLFGI
jgi:hypothetical protein